MYIQRTSASLIFCVTCITPFSFRLTHHAHTHAHNRVDTQAVTRVLAPYLSDHVHQTPPRLALAGQGNENNTNTITNNANSDDGNSKNTKDRRSTGSVSETEDGDKKGDAVAGLSAAAFVHDTRGMLPSPSGEQGEERRQERSAEAAETGEPTERAEPSSHLRDRHGQEWWGAAKDSLVNFVAKYMELSLVQVGPRLTNAVLVSVASGGVGNLDAVASGDAGLSGGAARLTDGSGGGVHGGGGVGSAHDTQAR